MPPIVERMNVKELKEKLNEFPDDMEVLITYRDPVYNDLRIEDYCNVTKSSVHHGNYTTKWQSNIDYYSFEDGGCVYIAGIGGALVAMKVSTEKKEFVILEV
jgi:hypothetical protein